MGPQRLACPICAFPDFPPPCSNLSAAFRWLRENVKNGDLVILENDLPDLYEESSGVFWKASNTRSATAGLVLFCLNPSDPPLDGFSLRSRLLR